MLREWSSCAFRNGVVQVLFLTTTRSIFVEKLLMLKEVRVAEWLKFFQENYVLKWVIFSASFCWLWDFLLPNLKLKDKFQIWRFESFIYWFRFLFYWGCFRRFSQCNFKISRHRPTMVVGIFTQPPHTQHFHITYGPEIH